MRKCLLFWLFFIFFCGFISRGQQDFGVRYTIESNHVPKYRPVFYIIWPHDFNGNKYDIKVHISYDVKLSDGSWKNYNDATIWGVSGKYELEWVYAYTKPIEDIKVRIKSIDGYTTDQNINTENRHSLSNSYYKSGDDYSGSVPLPSFAISGGYNLSPICYGPYVDIYMYMGEEIGGIIYGGYGSRELVDIYRMGIGGFSCGDYDTRNECAYLLEMAWEKDNHINHSDNMSIIFDIEYTRYFLDNNSVGVYGKAGVGIGGMNINKQGIAEKTIFVYSFQIGLKINVVNIFK